MLSACGGGSSDSGGAGATATDAPTSVTTTQGLIASESENDQSDTSGSAQRVSTLAAATTPTGTATSWAVCASEWSRCTFTGTRQVRYGTATKTVTKTLTNGALCANSTFGDPAPGSGKVCWIENPAAQAPVTAPAAVETITSETAVWAQCATEWTQCSFTGTQQVRYGTESKYVVKAYTGGAACNNTVFGDPAPGAGKACWIKATIASAPTTPQPVAPTTPSTPTVAAPAPSTDAGTTTPSASVTAGATPTPASIAGKRVVGAITATTGQIIENVHVSSSNSSCITIPNGVTNVVIRNSEIGPCGNSVDHVGVLIQPGASNVTVQRNVIHDVASGVYAYQANHPIVIDRNYVYNIRGPFGRGQMAQFNNVTGSAQSKITCNVSDGLPGTRNGAVHTLHNIEDHINMYSSFGTSSNRIEIAYNRLRGGSPTSTTGSGIMTGDSGGAWQWVHDNVIVNVANVGIGIAGGTNITAERNRVYMNSSAIFANVGMYVWKWRDSEPLCSTHTVKDNRVFNLSTVNGQNPYWNAGNCTPVTESGNTLGDTSLSATMFDQAPSQCL